MKSFFDKLNLRPQERRMVVIVGVIIFIVINVVFVMPIFGSYGKTMNEMSKSRQTLQRYETEIKKKGQYEQQLRQLESSGSYVGQEDQASKLMSEVTSQAALSGVTVMQYTPGARGNAGKTNSFFEEQTMAITVNTGEKELIDFLYSLGSGGSLVRVRSMTLSPEVPNRYKLLSNLTLVESFQKKPPAKAASAPSPAPAKTSTPTPPPAKRDTKTDAKAAPDTKTKKTPSAQ
jgi:hypothetical protein